MKELTFGSLFDGIGCFSLAFRDAGWRCLWTCEIDEDCRRVTASHFPEAKQYEDVKHVTRANTVLSRCGQRSRGRGERGAFLAGGGVGDDHGCREREGDGEEVAG
ncbi:MAG: DNA cytosine methyltransferase [Desulfurellales bacterium]|nr:MAG: DNA cytosine methyltransferase [Desulfurellales bacterium]